MAIPSSRTPPLSLLIVAALFLSSLCLQQPVAVAVAEAEAGKGFDLFVLSLYWADYVCGQSTKPYCCFENQCCRLKRPSGFVINGFWPDYADGTWPSCCNDIRFDEKKVSPLIPALVEFWPKLYCGPVTSCKEQKGSLWAYEWEKHGTCTSPVLNDQYNYFLKALNLYFKFNLMQALKNAGVTPSNSVTYPSKTIHRAISKAVGASPLLLCKKNSLYQVQLCFNKDFTVRDCYVSKLNNCPKLITLPTQGPVPRDGNAAIPWEANGGGFEPLIEI